MEKASAHRDEPDARDRILRAAMELIASDGIDEVRIARVANRARASTALVHHYFSTREELLAQALLQSFELAGGRALRRRPRCRRPPPRRASQSAIDECLPIPGESEREWVLWVELWLRAVREPELRPVAGRTVRELPRVGRQGLIRRRCRERRVPRGGVRTAWPTWRWPSSTASGSEP